MDEIYVAFVDTPGFFAYLIRKYLKIKYVHVVLSLDCNLTEAYSIGRRNPKIPLLAGFEKEEKEKISDAFPSAEYMICSFSCTSIQKNYIKEQLRDMYEKRQSIHYTVLGLPFLLLQQPFHQKNHYTCSSYLAKLLSQAGVLQWDKDYSLITPKDFFLREDKKVLFEGKLNEFIRKEKKMKNIIAFEGRIKEEAAYGQ